jgi:ABC-type glycerol-3-phosphate transport system permease component
MLLGYLFTRKDLPFRKFFYRLLLVTGYVSGGLIPGFLLYKNLGMLNTFWVYVIPGMISFGNVILIKTFIEQLPFSVQESAMMDGASDLTLFSKIIMPMSLPIVATIALFAAIGQWNSWFDTVAYAWANPNLKTLQSILREYMTQNDKMIALIKELGLDIDMSKYLTPWNARMTIVMITVVPVLLVYPILQRYYVKGIFIGAVKGM